MSAIMLRTDPVGEIKVRKRERKRKKERKKEREKERREKENKKEERNLAGVPLSR